MLKTIRNIALIVGTIAALSACSDEVKTEPVASTTPVTSPAVVQSPMQNSAAPTVSVGEVAEDSEIKRAVNGAVKTYVYFGHEIEDGSLWLTLNADNEATRDKALEDSLAAIKAVYTGGLMSEVTDVVVSVNDANNEIMIVEFSADTLSEIDFSEVTGDDIPTLADYFWE